MIGMSVRPVLARTTYDRQRGRRGIWPEKNRQWEVPRAAWQDEYAHAAAPAPFVFQTFGFRFRAE